MTAGFMAGQVCSNCLDVLRGPVAVCSACGGTVHNRCAVTHMHDYVCHQCHRALLEAREAQAQREQSLRAAHGLGMITARSSELLGTAMGAVGGATLAAGQFLAAGAVPGAINRLGRISPPPSRDACTVP